MTGRIPIVDLLAEYEEVAPALEEAVLRVLRSGRWVLGPETEALEADIAAFVGARHAVGVGSGTDALILALRALGVGPGDEVVTTPLTFFATIEAIAHAGATPVFADIERGGFNLDPRRVEAVLTPRTRAILPVHLFGRCADMEALRALADPRGIPLVEDAAQAIGSSRAGRRAGTWSALGCFSFYPAKSLGGAGDGGCVTTDDADLARRVRTLRAHGLEGDAGHVAMGTASRLDSIQAAVLRVKLPHLEKWLAQRSAHVEQYRAALADCADVALPSWGADEQPAWSQYVIRSPKAPAIRTALDAADIEWRHYYPRPAYREAALGDARLPEGHCPEAERACAEAVSIPIYPRMSAEAVDRVCGVIRSAVGA